MRQQNKQRIINQYLAGDGDHTFTAPAALVDGVAEFEGAELKPVTIYPPARVRTVPEVVLDG